MKTGIVLVLISSLLVIGCAESGADDGQQPQDFYGQVSIPEKILNRASRSWVTGLIARETNYKLALAKWADTGAVEFTALPGTYNIQLEAGFQGIVGNRYVVGGAGISGGPIMVFEFDLNSGQLLFQTQLGDARSRWGAAAQTAKGGLAGVVYADSSPENLVLLDAFYRSPDGQPMPGGDTNKWWWHRFQFTSNVGDSFPYLMSAVWWNQLLWIFYTRDSGGTISLVRFRIEGDALAVQDYEAGFIPRNVDASPSGELPHITAAVDPFFDRIVLAYQGAVSFRTDCPGAPWGAPWYMTEVKSDKSYYWLGGTAWWSMHGLFPKPLLWPRQDGIYFALQSTDVKGNCATDWKIGRLDASGWSTNETLPNGKALSLSEDGWFAFYDKISRRTDLIRPVFAPKIRISKNQFGVTMNWTPPVSSILEESPDLKVWTKQHEPQPPPVMLPLSSSQRFFRIISQ